MLNSFVNKFITLLELPLRVFGPKSKFIAIAAEQEYRDEFSVVRPRIIRRAGVSALIRAKNEEKNIEMVVDSIAGLFSEIIIIDNGSTDQTKAKIESLQKKYNNIKYFSYPFTLKKCGAENSDVDGNSVYSITHFSNWSIYQCSYSYIMKWDADMVLDQKSKPFLKTLLSSLNSYWPTFIATEQQTVYVKDGEYYESIGEINSECMIFPNRSDVFFARKEFFELLTAKIYKALTTKISDLNIYEVKHVADDEFAHWDITDFPTERKRREYKRFHELKDGLMENFRRLSNL